MLYVICIVSYVMYVLYVMSCDVYVCHSGNSGSGARAGSSLTRHDALVFSRKTWCQNARKDHNIESYVSFGTATKAVKTIWKDYKCNKLLESKLSMLNPIVECAIATDATKLVREEEMASYPLIAILVPVTTFGMSKPSLRDFDLFTLSMPSLMSSLDCGFRYNLMLGYDKGDPFYDTEKVRVVMSTVMCTVVCTVLYCIALYCGVCYSSVTVVK